MSQKPSGLQEIPEETAEVAHAAFPKGNGYMRMRDEFGTLYDDALFAAVYSATGQPGIAAWRLALVTVIQFCEGLTDRETAEAVRGRIDWKYALGLELRDPGFDFSVLSEFRDRLIAGGLESSLLDVLLAACKVRGWVKARGRQRTDSTHVLAAIRTLHRLEQIGQTFQAALDDLARVAPVWLKGQVPAEWFSRYGHKLEAYRFPKGDAKRLALATTIGQDGQQLLDWLDNQANAADLRARSSVEMLRQVWCQHYERQADGTLRWREKEELPPPSVWPRRMMRMRATVPKTAWTGSATKCM